MRVVVRQGEVIVGGSFIVAACSLPLLGGVPQKVAPATLLLFVAAIAVATCVRFDVGAGFTVPTQAIFVPMLFALPVTLVPLLVALALALGMAPDIVRGRWSPSRLLAAPGNAWFAWGPAVVLLLAHDHRPNGHWGVLILALAAQFACDFAANTVRQQLWHEVTFSELVEEVRPIYAIDLALSALGLALALAALPVHGWWPVLLVAPLFVVMRTLSNERHARLEQLIELNNAYQGTALVLGDVVEADDAYTGGHCKSVVRLAADVAHELGLDLDGQRNVEFGALLHDVGKIAVPNEIINKPGKLDEREWEIIKTHTIEGQKMLERVGGFMREIGGIVRSSHERWDGAGYPDGLSGAAIPLEARIISACDAFNAMTTTRSYRKAMPLPEAIAELECHAGTQFDPAVVGALLSVIAAEVDNAAPERVPDVAPDVRARLAAPSEGSVGLVAGPTR